jgi:hypothetical protein
MIASMPPRLLPGTRLQVDLAHYVLPWLQDILVRASSMGHVISQS